MHLGSSTCFVSFEDLPPVCLVMNPYGSLWGEKRILTWCQLWTPAKGCFNALNLTDTHITLSLRITLFGLALTQESKKLEACLWLATPLGIFWFCDFSLTKETAWGIFIFSMHLCHSCHAGFTSLATKIIFGMKIQAGIPWAQNDPKWPWKKCFWCLISVQDSVAPFPLDPELWTSQLG